MSILSLPTPLGALLAMLVFAATAIGIYLVAHRFWAWGSTSPEADGLAETISTRIGIIHGVVIGMMFANVTGEYTGMVAALEREASALIRLYNEMERHDPEHFATALSELDRYLQFVVKQQWPALSEGRGATNLTGREMLDGVWKRVYAFEPVGRAEMSRLLDEVESARNLRLFDAVGSFLPIFWYAAYAGFVLTLATLAVPRPTGRRTAVVALYGAMVGVVLYGILVLTRPYSPSAGVSPSVFQTLLDATL